MIKDYSKLAYKDDTGIRLIQPKSFTSATQKECKELQDLLFSGEYVLTLVAMPAYLKSMKGEKDG